MRREGFHEGSRRYTGQEFELDLVGTVTTDKKYQAELRELGGDLKTGYLPFQQALKLVKKFQPWDPTNPGKDFLKELRLEVIERLKLPPGQEDRVKVYTALRSPLDKFHGIDAFVEFKKNGQTEIATLDISLNPKKQEGYKADLIIDNVPDPKEDEVGYLKAVDKLAGQISHQLTLH